MTLATQAHLEKFLQIDVSDEPDAAVTMLLENATGIINSYIDRVLELTTYTAELYDPPDGSRLTLDEWPIDETTNAVAVTEGGTALVNGTDFLVTRNQLVRVTASGQARFWKRPWKPQSISVTYDAGYDFTTDPLVEPEAVVARDVCTRIAARVFQAAAAYSNAPTSASSIKSVALEGSDSIIYADVVSGSGGVTLGAPQLSDSDMAALDPLRRRVLVSGY